MPRVRFMDAASQMGEMDLSKVRVGDLVRFLADFRKIAGPRGVVSIRKDEVGEVVGLGPESMRVRAPGLRTAGENGFTEDVEEDVGLDVIAVLIDDRDPRVSSHRIGATPELVQVSMMNDDQLRALVEDTAQSMECAAPSGIPAEVRTVADEFARMFNGVLNYWLEKKWPPSGNPSASSAYQYEMAVGGEQLLHDQMDSAAWYAWHDMGGSGTGLWDQWEHIFPKDQLKDLRSTMKTHPAMAKAYQRLEDTLVGAISCDDSDDGGDDGGDEGEELTRDVERQVSPPRESPRMQASANTHLELWDVELELREAAKLGVDVFDRAAFSLTRLGSIANSATNGAWQALVAGFGFRRALSVKDLLPLVGQAMELTQTTSSWDIRDFGLVQRALAEAAADLKAGTFQAADFGYGDADKLEADLEAAIRMVDRSDMASWGANVDALVEISGLVKPDLGPPELTDEQRAWVTENFEKGTDVGRVKHAPTGVKGLPIRWRRPGGTRVWVHAAVGLGAYAGGDKGVITAVDVANNQITIEVAGKPRTFRAQDVMYSSHIKDGPEPQIVTDDELKLWKSGHRACYTTMNGKEAHNPRDRDTTRNYRADPRRVRVPGRHDTPRPRSSE